MAMPPVPLIPAGVWVVRHACAGHKSTWLGPDDARPLDEVGCRQSASLAGSLRDARITRLVSSPARRCTQTLEPLAEERRLEVEVDDRLAPDARLEQLLLMLTDTSYRDAVVCTHGEVLRPLRDRVLMQGVTITGAEDQLLAKGAAWHLSYGNGRLRLHVYGAEPPECGLHPHPAC